MAYTNFHQIILNNRLRATLKLIKQGNDVLALEREVALLVLDTMNVLQGKSLSLKESCQCFIKIEYALKPDLEKKTSEEFQELLAEAMLLDEVGAAYGPDLIHIQELAMKILNRDKSSSEPKLKSFISASRTKQKSLTRAR